MSDRSILLVSHLFPNPAETAKGTFMLNKAVALQEAGVKVVAISAVPYAPFFLRRMHRFQKYRFRESEAEYGGVAVHYTRYFRPPGAFYKAHEGRSMHRSIRKLAYRLHQNHGFDFIIGGMLTNDGCVAMMLKHELQLPSYCFAIGSDVHTYPRLSQKIRSLTGGVVQHLDGILPVGRNFAKMLDRSFPGHEEKIFCNPLGVDTQVFVPEKSGALREQLGLESDVKIALFVGRLSEEKGVGDLLQALPDLCDEKVFFVLVGSGPLSARIESERRPNCRILSDLGFKELVRAYQGADFFLFPSHNEGSPTVMIEAAACGLPILASDIPGNHDVLTENANGSFFKPRDPGDLVKRLKAFLRDERLREFGERSRAVATDHFDRRSNAEALVSHLWNS